MASIKDIISPSKVYKEAKEAYLFNIEDYFKNIIKESNTNIDANKQTCESYYKKLNEIQDSEKILKKLNRKRSFLKFLRVVCFILIITIPFGLMINSNIKNKLNKNIEDASKILEKKNEEANQLKQEAIKQTSLLNAMYDWNVASSIFTKTIPLVEMDNNFNVTRFQQLHDKYGYKEHEENSISTVFAQSGSIKGNPFVIEKNYVCEMGNYTYTGMLVIHWTTTSMDSNGHSHTVHHSQTLTAYLTKPKPYYYLDTWLVYGNDAAPDLKFSRSPTNTKGMDEKSIKRLADKTEKALSKKTKHDISFTQMANSKFEGLFKAFNRTDEVQFRLLFTPLAQSNLIDLITMNEPYGDDFFFYKNNCLNYIKSAHSQNFDYSSSPLNFVDFDVSKAKEKVTTYADQYFDHLFFDLAPILSIPLYQNNKSREYIYKDNHLSRVTKFEAESLANSYDRGLFAHKDTKTDVILKTKFIARDGDVDAYNVDAYSYKTIPHTDFVPVLGGDGHMHPVPVHWLEYIPISKSTPFIVKNIESTRYKFNNIDYKNVFSNRKINNVYYQKGLVSALINK